MAAVSKKLSVVIPTYNFASFLPGALETILPQANANNVEVLIFDGCSTDETQEVVTEYKKQYSCLRYVRAMSKGGIDHDMSLGISLASSRYCWLFSADDACIDGSLEYLLSLIDAFHPDLILCRHNECDFEMNVIKDWPVLSVSEERLFELGDYKEQEEYANSAETSEAFFSFMGGLVVKRDAWFKLPLFNDASIKNWAHISRLWTLASDSLKVLYTPRVLLNRRGGNDSFSKDGMLERLRLQINGLQSAIKRAACDPVLDKNIKRVILNEVYPDWVNAVVEDLKYKNATELEFGEVSKMLNDLRN